MRAGVIGGKLFFKLADGSSISCECIANPYATQIADEIERLQSEVEKLREEVRQANGQFQPETQK